MAEASGTRRDLKRELKGFYTAPQSPEILRVPAFSFLMVDGAGDPNSSPAFAAAIEVLYSVSYTLKFMIKKGPSGIDYGVMPLEALWWADDMSAFQTGDRAAWKWTAMILQPDLITSSHVADARDAVAKKSPALSLSGLRFEVFEEGEAVQLLHVGPYASEAPDIARLHAAIAETGGRLVGRHHEIYLSDMRRTAPDKLRTIIRQPFVRS